MRIIDIYICFLTAILITYIKGGTLPKFVCRRDLQWRRLHLLIIFTEVNKFYRLMLLLYPGELYRLLGASSFVFFYCRWVFFSKKYSDSQWCWKKNILIFGRGKKNNVIQSFCRIYNLMLNSGKIICYSRDKQKNILTLVLSEKKILKETKNHNPTCRLNGRSLIRLFQVSNQQP